MKLPMSWLRDWVETDATAEQVADALTRRGFYVAGLEVSGRSFPGVVVAKVLEVSRHPNADRLTLCRVTDGTAEVRVVCGAPNVKPGMVVPLATVGAKLPGGTVIQASKIRGQESQGMLCSARELELSDDHEGIVDLEGFFGQRNGLAIGRPLEELFGPADTVLEVEVPFNRPDGLGIVGLAREVKAALDARWSEAGRGRLDRHWSGRSDFDLELEDPEGCPRYLAQAINGVAAGPSPRWLAQRLESVGQRPINLIVDLTNFVLFEFGQPLHAFDLDRLQGPAIRVRRARAGERIVTLDGRERELDPEVLVIADRARPVAIAGVMGGADSEVVAIADPAAAAPEGLRAADAPAPPGARPGSAGYAGAARAPAGDAAARTPTTRILLECAWFNPVRIRRAARALGLATEASRRFERGVDPEIGPVATARFLSLLREILADIQLGPAREKIAVTRPNAPLALRLARLDRVLGATVPPEEAARHLESLEFTVRRGDPLRITIPPWRPDIVLEEDLVEEVARARGYDKIPEAPLETHGVHATRSITEHTLARARAAMLARGLTEAWCTSLVSQAEAAAAARLLGQEPGRLVRLRNPMSREGEVLRPNPVPGLLRACALNLRAGEAGVRLFEVGTHFLAGGSECPEETPMLGAIVCGPRYRHAHDTTQQQVDFDDAKGLWEAWLAELRVDTPEWRAYAGEGWKPGVSAEVVSGTSQLGWAGTLSPALLRIWDIEATVHLFVALLDPLSRETVARTGVTLPGRFPPVRRDLAFFLPQGTTHGQVERVLIEAAGEQLASIELFDVYAGPGTLQGMRSLAFALQFQHPERTLTESEVQAIQNRMVDAVAKQCGGRLRER